MKKVVRAAQAMRINAVRIACINKAKTGLGVAEGFVGGTGPLVHVGRPARVARLRQPGLAAARAARRANVPAIPDGAITFGVRSTVGLCVGHAWGRRVGVSCEIIRTLEHQRRRKARGDPDQEGEIEKKSTHAVARVARFRASGKVPMS